MVNTTKALRLPTLVQRYCAHSTCSKLLVKQQSQGSRVSCTALRQRRHTSSYNSQYRPKQARAFSPLLLSGVAVVGAVIYIVTRPQSRTTVLNPDTFVPYTVSSREAISPESFIIDVLPRDASSAKTYLRADTNIVENSTGTQWLFPQWSVEFKQPEVQIARHYTPMPLSAEEDPSTGVLRFYIRTVNGGEMSTYLDRLEPGKEVWLRGPHPGFDIRTRLGEQKRVVFLAGGTGVVPGLQVAREVLDSSSDTEVNLLWAIRHRRELQKPSAAPESVRRWWQVIWPAEKKPEEIDGTALAHPSAIGRQLQKLKAEYGERLKIRVAIDEELTRFREKDLRDAWCDETFRNEMERQRASATSCTFHDQQKQVRASEFDPPGYTCTCPPGTASSSGKNLFMVSGPEGFVAYYAGQKVWREGIQTQGQVGGVLAKIQQNKAHLKSEWLVLKL